MDQWSRSSIDKCELVAYTELTMDIRVPKHDCKEELRRIQLRVTPARLGVLDILEHAKIPIDVSTLIQGLKSLHIKADEATVFRIINTFCEKGLITPIQLNENKLRYEYADKPTHHHFMCEKCGDISDIEGCVVGELETQIEKMIGAHVSRHSLEFFGLCKRCTV